MILQWEFKKIELNWFLIHQYAHNNEKMFSHHSPINLMRLEKLHLRKRDFSVRNRVVNLRDEELQSLICKYDRFMGSRLHNIVYFAAAFSLSLARSLFVLYLIYRWIPLLKLVWLHTAYSTMNISKIVSRNWMNIAQNTHTNLKRMCLPLGMNFNLTCIGRSQCITAALKCTETQHTTHTDRPWKCTEHQQTHHRVFNNFWLRFVCGTKFCFR